MGMINCKATPICLEGTTQFPLFLYKTLPEENLNFEGGWSRSTRGAGVGPGSAPEKGGLGCNSQTPLGGSVETTLSFPVLLPSFTSCDLTLTF